MSSLWQDVRYGLRMLRARPGFALVAVVTLALGVGANTAIFSAVNAMLLRPLPMHDVDRLAFGMSLREGFDPFGTSLLEYELYRDESRSFESLGLGTPRLFNLVGWGEPERLRGAAVMASYLSTLGVKPVLGRTFLEEEDRPGGPAVALVSHELWQRRLGGERDVIGRTLSLEGRSHVIVGVLPPGFDVPYSASVWVPMQVSIGSLPLDQQASNGHELVARLRPGVPLAAADAELKTLARKLEQRHPQIRRGWSYGVIPLRQQLLADLEGRARRSLHVLVGAVGFLLLISCANVGSLLLARGVAREGEIAIRRSLGAGTGRLVRQLLTESVLLAVLGGAAGVLLAAWIQPLLGALSPLRATGLGHYLTDFQLDWRVLAFSIAITLLAGIVSGVAPSLRAVGSSGLMGLIRRREQRAGVGGGRRSLGALVVAEIAIAATLLVGGGLMVRSFQRLQELELGFDPHRVLTMELPLSPSRYATQARRAQLVDEVVTRVRALPGVAAAGVTTNLPMQRGMTLDAVFEVEGRPRARPSDVPITAHRVVTPGYPETIGVELLAGRHLDARDVSGAAPVVVVSEALVRQAWPDADPLGKRLRRLRAGQPGPWMTVVGVTRDVKEDRFGFRVDRPVWYVPYAQQVFPLPLDLPLNLVVRAAAGDPLSLAGAVRAAVREIDPDQPVASAMTMEDGLSDVLVAERFSAILMGALAALGLLLATLGLYGTMAYTVGSRTGEIGLRIALGARPRDVLRLVLGHGLALVGGGLVLGVAGAWTLTRLLASTLHEVRPSDPATFAVGAAVLTVTGLLACWLPARRAMRIEPMAALRSD
jgi:putative ABC transport system permease protein